MMDLFYEVYASISRNKMRVALTGFSIAWGIFMLVVLLGAGNGLFNGMNKMFASNYATTNLFHLWPGQTTLPFKNLSKGRDIHFEAEDMDYLCREFPAVMRQAMPSINVYSARLAHGKENDVTTLVGYGVGFEQVAQCKLIKGRLFNAEDMRSTRKVIIVSDKQESVLFGQGGNALGKYVNVYEIPFLVVGVYDTKQRMGNSTNAYVPISTISAIFKPEGYYGQVDLVLDGLKTLEQNKAFETALLDALARRKSYDPADKNAVYYWNQFENYVQSMTVLSALQLFIWIIGIASMIAGVVGVSNIMVIAVKERTHEFGIRKAIGASPRSIIGLVLLESVSITLLFGYVGMVLGIGLTQLLKVLTDAMAAQSNNIMFSNPTVDLNIVLAATGVLVLAGLIAGYVPAKKAVSIKPIDALMG